MSTDKPEQQMRDAVVRISCSLLREMPNPVSETYVQEQVAMVLDDATLHIISRYLVNEVRAVFGLRKPEMGEPDPESEESMTEYLRRKQG